MPPPEKSIGEKIETFVGEAAEKVFGIGPNFNKRPDAFDPTRSGVPDGRAVPTVAELPVPPVRRGNGGPDGPITIDTNVMLYFADVVDQLIPNIEKALTEIGQVDVRPGNFMHADAIIQKIEGGEGGGLKPQYTESLTKMRDGCTLLVQRCRELGKKYDTTDELNKKGAEELGKVINEVGGYLPTIPGGNAANPGGTQSPGPPANNDDKNDTGKNNADKDK
jgi:hypothetical protein